MVETLRLMCVLAHPDHIAICQLAHAAVVCAANAGYELEGQSPHRVSKRYYMVDRRELVQEYETIFDEASMQVDGMMRRQVVWEDWAITAWVDTEAYWQTACHRSQLPGFDKLANLPEERHKRLWGCQTSYRALSLVNGGRQVEHDLFEGLR